jgi:Uma2 family endonuclease
MAEATDTTDTVGTSRRMTYEQFWELPDDLRAEYSDGEVIVNPAPSFRHQKIARRLADLLTDQLGPDAVVAMAVGWQLVERRRLRIPDVVVLTSEPDGDIVTDPPLVAVEVLSTNRSSDLVRKATEYLDARAGQYWIVDPRDRVIDVFAHGESGWEHVARVSDGTPTARFEVAPFGHVTLVLGDLLD